jgi:hypothetical protein
MKDSLTAERAQMELRRPPPQDWVPVITEEVLALRQKLRSVKLDDKQHFAVYNIFLEKEHQLTNEILQKEQQHADEFEDRYLEKQKIKAPRGGKEEEAKELLDGE